MSSLSTDIPHESLWYRIDLSREEFEGGEADVIEGAFRQIYFASNAPLGMAMLSARKSGNAGFSIYFTPRSLPHARALVLAYEAVPLAPPFPAALTLRVGDGSAAMAFLKEF
jgi:hypothetical protein